MKKILIFTFFFIYSFLAIAQPKESMCKYALKFQDYATLGDCYKYGVLYGKDLEKAKLFYIYGAMHKAGQGEYGKLQAAMALLFSNGSDLEKAMGLYILKDFSDRDDVEIVTQPKYEGDYTRRGSARYLLAIYFAQQKDYAAAEDYLSKALEDNDGGSAFALVYLDEIGKASVHMSQVEKYAKIKTGEEKQRIFFPWDVQSFSCWLEQQLDIDRMDVSFPVEHAEVEQLIKKYGRCSKNIPRNIPIR